MIYMITSHQTSCKLNDPIQVHTTYSPQGMKIGVLPLFAHLDEGVGFLALTSSCHLGFKIDHCRRMEVIANGSGEGAGTPHFFLSLSAPSQCS